MARRMIMKTIMSMLEKNENLSDAHIINVCQKRYPKQDSNFIIGALNTARFLIWREQIEE